VELLSLQAPGSSRDLLLLDIALESWLRLLVERQDKRALSGDDLVELMGLMLGNAALTVRVMTCN
jgi:alpha-glucan,water dikinase